MTTYYRSNTTALTARTVRVNATNGALRRENDQLRALLSRAMPLLNTVAVFLAVEDRLTELDVLRADIASVLHEHDSRKAS